MLEPRPPRRDPRLLLLEARGRHVVYVALDAWEIHGLGFITKGPGLQLACARLLLQIRPSQIAPIDLPPALHAAVTALAHTRGIAELAVSRADRERLRRTGLDGDELAKHYPELRGLRTRWLSPSIRLASALFAARSPSLSRHYVSRLPPRAETLMDA